MVFLIQFFLENVVPPDPIMARARQALPFPDINLRSEVPENHMIFTQVALILILILNLVRKSRITIRRPNV